MSIFYSEIVSKTILIVTIASSVLFAQDYGYFQIAEEPTTPRISAMGGAGTALSGGGFGSYNPAAPAFADEPFLSVEYGSLPGDLSKSKIETSWMFPKWFAGVSLQVHSTDFFNANEQTDETTMYASSSSDQAMLATLAGGYIFGRWAVAGGLNFLQERIGDQTWHAFTFCPGVQFRLIPGRVTVGASLLHYLRFDTTGSPWYTTPAVWYRSARGLFPRYARAGIAWRDTVRRWALPFTAVGDFVYSDVYERFMVPLGVEVWVLPFLAARTGITINHPSEIIHFGVGIRLMSSMKIDFDYGMVQPPVPGAALEAKWLVGLTWSLHKKKQEAAPKPLRQKPADTTPAAVPKLPGPVKIVPIEMAPPARPLADTVQIPVYRPDTTAKILRDTSTIRRDSSATTPAPASAAGNTISPNAVPSVRPDTTAKATPDTSAVQLQIHKEPRP